jgi:ribosome-associated toxin RatA of RatAB toxin-antitoxin module
MIAPMPAGRRMTTIDERVVRASRDRIYDLAADVERWPALLPHYRYVRFRERGIVEMSANRPFGPANWPTWWVSEMNADREAGIRFHHIEGITTGVDVLWTFEALPGNTDTRVRITHLWDGPRWPVIGPLAAVGVIGPVFIHGIASRTLAGLATVAERGDGI